MDWNDMQTWHWFAIIGGGVLVLGVIFYFLPLGKLKIPSVITASFGALGLGLSLGIIFMAGLGYRPTGPEQPPLAEMDPGFEPKMMGGPGAKGKGGAAPGGAAKGKMGGGGGAPAPSPRLQLAALVNALDSLSEKPITITLTAEDRKAIADQLQGLDSASEIKDADAKAKLEAIQAVVLKQRQPLEKIGYRWVLDGKTANRTFPKDSPNPFKEGADAERLKSLLERLSKN